LLFVRPVQSTTRCYDIFNGLIKQHNSLNELSNGDFIKKFHRQFRYNMLQ
jgi:hypothetical protein